MRRPQSPGAANREEPRTGLRPRSHRNAAGRNMFRRPPCSAITAARNFSPANRPAARDTDSVVAARASRPAVTACRTSSPMRGPGDLTAHGSSAPILDRRRAATDAVELDLKVRRDIESQATVNGVSCCWRHCRTSERGAGRARGAPQPLARRRRSPLRRGQAVVGGQMRELMADARRVAPTNVSVLITGESGTGKEILARAIHASPTAPPSRSSPSTAPPCRATCSRASCSAIAAARSPAPTATTPASIGAARDGTLFLDEIGELGLDLQPKLLRFLESGEICPLGESDALHRQRPHRRRHQRQRRAAGRRTAGSATTCSTG